MSSIAEVLVTSLEQRDAQVAALIVLAMLPSATPLCPFCLVLDALPWPEYASDRLCSDHLPVFRALQCKGWNADGCHQHLAALARWGRLPDPVDWWP